MSAKPSPNPPRTKAPATIVTSCGVLLDDDGRLLLVHRLPDRDRWPDVWYLPGGEALDGEDVDDTLVRELDEELGIDVREFEFLDTIFDTEPESGRHAVHNIYLVRAHDGRPSLKASQEHDALQWVAPADFEAHALPASLRNVLRLVLGGDAVPLPVEQVDQRDVWNAMSAHYQAHHAIPLDQIHYGPNVPTEDELCLVGDPAGKDVIEVGCGGGQNAIVFKKRGAARVAGIDISDEQIAYARDLAEREGVQVEFRQGTVENLGHFDDASFDVAFSAYCFSYVPDLAATMREVFRVLRPGGRFAFSLDHPIAGMTGDDGVTFARSYFDREMEWFWFLPNAAGTRMTAIYRPIGEIFATLRDAGFDVETILEPRHGAAAGGVWDEPMYTQTDFPTTVIFAARKPAANAERPADG